ncbi:MAG: hypothetical protein V2B18_19120 [Pseudomonadota bacterium]
MSKRKPWEGLLSEDEIMEATGISAKTLSKFEGRKYIRGIEGPKWIKFYTRTAAEIVKAMMIRAPQCANLDEAHLVAIQDLAFKNVQHGDSDSWQYLMLDPETIKKHPRFAELLDLDEGLREIIAEEMKILGFCLTQPLLLAVWAGHDEPVVAEGNTRLDAAIMAGIRRVPAVIKRFPSEEGVVLHIANAQAKRRQTKDWVLYRLIAEIDKRMKRGKKCRSGGETSNFPASAGNTSGRSASARRTGALLGCNFRKVERVRTIINRGTRKIREAVRDGRMTINDAFNLITKKQQGRNSPHKDLVKQLAKEVAVLLEELDATALEEIGGNLVESVAAAVKECIVRNLNERARPEQRDSLAICAECRL